LPFGERALQTMLSISTTLIKRHLQFAIACGGGCFPGLSCGKWGKAEVEAGNWHCQLFYMLVLSQLNRKTRFIKSSCQILKLKSL